MDSEAWTHYAATGKMRWREFATAPKYESLGARLADIANTLLGTMGLSQGVTDNASVNIIPLQVLACCLPVCRCLPAQRQQTADLLAGRSARMPCLKSVSLC